MNPKRLLYIVLYIILLNGLVRRYVISNQYVPLLADALLFLLAFAQLPNNFRDIKRAIGTPVVALFSILLLGSTAVAVINAMSLISILWGLRMVVRYLLLFCFIYKYFNVNDVLKFRQILIKFFWMNAAVVLFQYFVEGIQGDFLGGIFMSNGELFVFCLFCAFLFSKDYFDGRLNWKRFFLFLAFEMFIAMAAEIKIMYFTIPFAIYAVYIFTKRFSMKHVVILVVAFFCLIPAMKATMSLMYGENYVNSVFDIDRIQEETTKAYNLSEEAAEYSFNRSTCVEKATTLILRDKMHILIGYGIGSGNASDKFGTWIYQTYAKITSYNWFTSSWLLIEYGWIGYIMWIIILCCVAWRFYSVYKKTTDKDLKYWSSLGLLSVLFTFIVAWYNNMPYYNAYLFYSFWAVCFVAIRERIKQLSSIEKVD